MESVALADVSTRALREKIALTKEETRGDPHRRSTHNLQSRSLWHRLDDRRTADELRETHTQTIDVLIRVFLSEFSFTPLETVLTVCFGPILSSCVAP